MIAKRMLAFGGLGMSIGFVVATIGLFLGEMMGPHMAELLTAGSVLMIVVGGVIAILGCFYDLMAWGRI